MATQENFSQIATTALTSVTLPLEISVGNGIYVVLCEFTNDQADELCTGVTWDGVAAEKVIETQFSRDGEKVFIYRLILENVVAGTYDAVATFASTNHEGRMAAVVFTDVNPTSPDGPNPAAKVGLNSDPLLTYAAQVGDVFLDAVSWLKNSSLGNITHLSGGLEIVKNDPPGSPVHAQAVYRKSIIFAGEFLNSSWDIATSVPYTWAAGGVLIRDVNNSPPAPVYDAPSQVSDFLLGGQA